MALASDSAKAATGAFQTAWSVTTGMSSVPSAVVAAIPGRKNWFPTDVPVLLAQLEGGEGDQRDTGLTVDSDRVLVRVVGYGGI